MQRGVPGWQVHRAMQRHCGSRVRRVQHDVQRWIFHEWRVLGDGPVGHYRLRHVLFASYLPREHVHASGPVPWHGDSGPVDAQCRYDLINLLYGLI